MHIKNQKGNIMNPMCLSIEECIEKTTIKDKVNFIIQSYNTPMKKFMLSVFSILLNSKEGDLFEHICICINGPDKRTGNTQLQDNKQKFIEELRAYGWHPYNHGELRSAPLTLIRVWSRVGKSESIEMATNWVHTNNFIIMDDDVILNKGWENDLNEFIEDDKIAIAGVNMEPAKVLAEHNRGMYLIKYPRMNTKFIACKKKHMIGSGGKFNEYFVPSDHNYFEFDHQELKKEFFDFWSLSPDEFRICLEKYNYVWHQLGSWIYFNLKAAGLKIKNINEKILSQDEQEVENEIKKYPRFEEIYRKYIGE